MDVGLNSSLIDWGNQVRDELYYIGRDASLGGAKGAIQFVATGIAVGGLIALKYGASLLLTPESLPVAAIVTAGVVGIGRIGGIRRGVATIADDVNSFVVDILKGWPIGIVGGSIGIIGGVLMTGKISFLAQFPFSLIQLSIILGAASAGAAIESVLGGIFQRRGLL